MNKWTRVIANKFNIGDKVRKGKNIGIIKNIFNGDKDKNGNDIKYLAVQFENKKEIEAYPLNYFRKINESINEDFTEGWEESLTPEQLEDEERASFEQTIDHYMTLLLEGNHIFDEDREMLKNEKDQLEKFLRENLDNLNQEFEKRVPYEYTPLHEYDMGPDQQLYEDEFNEVKYIIDEYKKWKAVKGI